MSMTRRSLLALGLTFATVSMARAWEGLPREPQTYQTTVSRVLDVARGQWGPAVALAESPAAGCAALTPPARLNDSYGEAWVQRQENGSANAGEMLAIALAARAQNLPVRIFLMNWNGECVVSEIRTCSDPVACTPPPAR